MTEYHMQILQGRHKEFMPCCRLHLGGTTSTPSPETLVYNHSMQSNSAWVQDCPTVMFYTPAFSSRTGEIKIHQKAKKIVMQTWILT